MGYRSEVKYVLLFNTEENFNTFKAHAQLTLADSADGREILEQMDEHKYERTAYPYHVYVAWEDVKWYDSYAWVQMQDELMTFVDGMDGCGFAYARVGEEHGDVEVKCSEDIHAYDFLDVRTIIDFI